MEKDRAEQEEGEGAGHLDEVVDPVVARRPEPADEEEHEEDAEEEEDLRRGVPRAPGIDEEAEPEEERPEQGVVDVRRRAEPVGREDQLELENLLSPLDEVRNSFRRGVPSELGGRLGRGVQHSPPDAEEGVAGPDPGRRRRSPGDDGPNVDPALGVGVGDDAVPRLRQEHVGHRHERNERTESSEKDDGPPAGCGRGGGQVLFLSFCSNFGRRMSIRRPSWPVRRSRRPACENRAS